MKKIIAIVTIILAALSLASCNMDFYSSDSMTSAQLAENPSSAVYTTDGIYTLFKDRIAYKGQSGGESGNYYIRHYFQLAELRGNNVTVSGKSEDPFTEAYMYSEDPTHKNIYYTWWIGYKIINAANSNIDAIVPGASALSDHLLGENYFFRALLHFQLVNLFAMPYAQGRENPGIVLRQDLDISTTKRATVGEVYDAVVNDLIEAKKFLANGESERIKGGTKAYVSLDAATALLSRVYLYMGENEKCIQECNELLAHAPSSVTSGYGEHAEASIASMYIKDGNGWGEHYWNENLIDNFRRYPEDKRFAAYFSMPEYKGQGYATTDKVTVVFPVKTDEKSNSCSDARTISRSTAPRRPTVP